MTTHPAGLLPPLPDRPPLVLADGIAFRPGRVHELCGRSRRVLAAMICGLAAGPVIWGQSAWQRDRLYPPGMVPFCDPGQILVARGHKPVDLLWTVEESLRSGAVAVAIAELQDPPGLTPVRRLQLAAEAGGGRAIGLLLTPGSGGAPGVESRWQIEPAPGGGWHAHRLRARMEPEARLHLHRGPDGAFLTRPAGLGAGQQAGRA